MSVIPEVILHRTITRGFKALRNDPRVISSLFMNIDQEQLTEIKKLILNNSISFSINFPRKTPQLPGIVLLLKAEKESQTFLGDLTGAFPHYSMPDPEMTMTLGHGASVSSTSGLPELLLGNVGVSYSTSSTVFFGENYLEEVEQLIEDFDGNTPSPRVYVTGGTGAGQSFRVISMSPISLDISGVFDPHLDSSSIIDIRKEDDSELFVGEPSRVYDHNNSGLVRKGANYSVQYQLNILAGNQEEVIYLYTILKALFFSQKKFLEGQGIQALEISGSDFAPRSEYLGNEIFQRIMNISFVYVFQFTDEIEVFDNIELCINPDDPNEPHVHETVLCTTIEL